MNLIINEFIILGNRKDYAMVTDLEKFVKVLACAVVVNHQAIKVEKIESPSFTVIVLQVAREDMGRIIGKGGAVADAMRRLLIAAVANGAAPTKRVALEIIENRG